MAIVDPFDATAAAPSKGIVDPFEGGATAQPPRTWADVPAEAAKNLLPSAYHDVVEPFANLYANNQTYGAFNPFKLAYHIGSALYDDPSLVKKIPTAIINKLKEDYGSEEGFKNKLATDPAGFGLDALMLAGGGEAAYKRIAGSIGDIAKAADVAKPFYDLPREPPAPPPPPASPVQSALDRLREGGTPVDVPRAVTSASPTVRAGGQALSVAPIVGTPLREAVHAVPAQMGEGVEKIAQRYGARQPENIVGGGIEQSLSGAAQREASAAQTAAEASDAAATQKWEAANQAREQAITDRLAAAHQDTRRTFGSVDPNEMSEDAIAQVQAAESQARSNKEARYERVNDLDARVSKDAFSDVQQTAEGALKDAGFTIDAASHPNAVGMMREFQRLTGRPTEAPPNVPPRVMTALRKEYGDNIPPAAFESLGFPGAQEGVEPDFRLMGKHAPAAGAQDVPIQGVEALRKRVGQMAFNAEGDADRAASGIMKNAFDDWYERATENHLTPDSDLNALDVIREARAANADWRNRFGYNHASFPAGGERRNAARILNRMVTGDIGPEELSRQLIGAKPGTRGISAPLYDAMSGAVQDPAALRNNLRGAYWNRIAPEGRSADRIASDVGELRSTRMGDRLFEPAEHDQMRDFGDLAQRTPQDLRQAAVEAKANKPKPTKPEPGKAEQLASKMLGRNRSDEAVFGTFDRMLREGGDIKNAARTWGRLSDANRNDVRAALLRNMGGGGEHFNVAEFVKNWESYTPQAKAILLDRDHRQNLQDFYTVAKQYKDTIAKYGNPSGTAQVSAWHKLGAGTFKGAVALAAGHTIGLVPSIVTIATGLGARKLSRILATPEGAQQVARWSRLAQAYERVPSARTLALLSGATHNLNQQ